MEQGERRKEKGTGRMEHGEWGKMVAAVSGFMAKWWK